MSTLFWIFISLVILGGSLIGYALWEDWRTRQEQQKMRRVIACMEEEWDKFLTSLAKATTAEEIESQIRLQQLRQQHLEALIYHKLEAKK